MRIRPPHNASLSSIKRSISAIPKSTVHIGTSFETLTAHTLARFAFSLTQVGGARDRGIDLIGSWSPPSQKQCERNAQDLHTQTQNIPIIVQCKAITKTVPAWVRELEGAIAGAPPHLGEDVVGVLVGKGKLTQGILEVMNVSGKGIVWVQLNEKEKAGREGVGVVGGRVKQMLWNRVVTERIGDHLRPGFVYRTAGRGVVEREMALLWKGKAWEPKRVEARWPENKKGEFGEG